MCTAALCIGLPQLPLLLVTVILCSCNGPETAEDHDASSTLAQQADQAAAASPEIRGGETYSAYDDRRHALEGAAGSYAGYDCTEDCSGHEAGYQWEDHDITDPEDCGGTSWSFEEGCRAYADDQPDDSDDGS